MMKYIIRSIGWVFDDSVFEKDSLFKTVATYTDKTEALGHLSRLNREFFLAHLDSLYRYELWDNYGEARQAHREELDTFLIREFDLNPTIAIHPWHQSYSITMFLEKPTPEQVDRLIEKSGLRFFQLIEMDEETPFIKARFNPEYVNAASYFYEDDSERVLIFSSEEQAITRFASRDFEYYAHIFSKHALLRQPLSALTKFPAILEDLIWGSEGLTFSDEGLRIAGSVDAKAFMKLNALLLKPFILFETAAKEDERIYDQSHLRWVEKDNRRGWEEVESRSQAFNSIEELKWSMSYLESYYFQLPKGSYFEYERILSEYLGQLLGQTVQQSYHRHLEVGGHSFIFHGVIMRAAQKQGIHQVESLFGFNKKPILLESKIGQGTGKTLQKAFYESLKDWLEKNEELILKLINAAP